MRLEEICTMINIIEGDLIQMLTMPGVEAVAHGCNCFCRMGAGFALQLATAVPAVLTADLMTAVGDTKKLGTYSTCSVGGIEFFNLYTQYYYGRRQMNFDIMAFRTSFVPVIRDLISRGKTSIHIPFIGSNLGGGDWDEIFEMIQRIDIDECRELFVINIVKWTR